ncbi:MAG: 50S ribosomal protein L35ae [Nanoarchaeota archaeon]
MEAVIIHYRGSKKNRYKYGNHIILKVPKVDNKESALKLLHKTVKWKSSSGKLITGEIVKEHGNKGAVRAIFERGLPGQALGKKVEVL